MWKDLPVVGGLVLGAGALAAANNAIPVWQALLIASGVFGSVIGIDWALRAIFPAYRRARQRETSPDR